MKRVFLRRASATVVAALVALTAPWLGALPASAGEASGAHHPSRHHSRGYAALGDSYSSGEGSGSYRPGTDTGTGPDANRCHRSSLAYGPLLRRSDRRLKPLSFVACSGALTHDLYAPNHQYAGEGPQLAAINERTRVVTLTIGGNDANFVTAVQACLQLGPSGGFGCSQSPELNALVTAGVAALAGQASVPDQDGNLITPISKVLADIHQRAPRAKIYLAGYPDLFGSEVGDFSPEPGVAPSGSSCVLNASVGARIDYADAQWFNRNTQALNTVFKSAVLQARKAGVRATYVSPSTFDGHGLCDAKTSWIQPLLLTGQIPNPESLHPTPTGQRKGYARAFHRAGL